MIDFTQLKEGKIVLFDFDGKTYEREIKKYSDGDFYFDLSGLDEFKESAKIESHCFWFIENPSSWRTMIRAYNVRFKPEQYNFHVGQKVSYVVDGKECIGTVINAQVYPHDLIIYEDKLEEDIWLYHNDLQEWDETDIEKYQVKPITITDMETPIEPDFDQQIIDAKLEFTNKVLKDSNNFNNAFTNLVLAVTAIEQQRRLYNAEQLWKRLRNQVVSDEDDNGDKKFYDMIQDLELYYETKLKPIVNTPKEFTSNDGC